ncbi:MAG TPA: choice-of-anchor J domain-containing protein, partial [Bacteroidia bacterium]|nr:choice-of-anchor J domain-containing protein [Bacteroidia bacterium]
SKMAYITIEPDPGNVLPLVQNFQSSTSLPAGWAINNPNGHSTTWAVSTATGGFGKSTQCIYYNNCTGGIAGNYDQFYTPTYNFSGDANPLMHFDVAYAPQDASFSDTLAIYYSTDCGTTWNNIYLKGGLQLGTFGGDYTSTDVTNYGCFVPSSTQWRTDTIKVPAIAGQTNVLFSFENRSGNGLSMYIDNINIPGAPLATPTLANTSKVSIYPNPNNGSFTVDINNAQDKQQLEIYNMLGQNIYGTVVMEGKTQVNFTQTPGVYFYRILTFDGKMVSEGKVIVK